ncbi:hypothetical protein AB2L27_18175 [Kineococcus sp. LSe6-4]|uniref:YcaO domain-containing protein n=1 Tax=Kineococcus halophytocola TaxID=3234027 RepID=A0ABV4H5X5_9ACTN
MTTTTNEPAPATTVAHRVQLRGDVIYARTPQGVLVHDSRGGFQVRGTGAADGAYEAVDAVLARLDGTATAEEVLAGLAPDLRRRAPALLTTLRRHGFLLDRDEDSLGLPPDRLREFAEQISYAQHFGALGGRGFAAVDRAHAHLVGSGELLDWVVLGLVRNGFRTLTVHATASGVPGSDVVAELADLRSRGVPVEVSRQEWPGGGLAGADVVVVAPGDGDPRLVDAVSAAAQEVPLLSVWAHAGALVTGPVQPVGSTVRATWRDAVERLTANADPDDAARFWAAVGDGVAPGAPVVGALAAMTGNLLAFEAFRALARIRTAAPLPQVLVQDVLSGDVAAATVVPNAPAPEGRRPPGTSVPVATRLDRAAAGVDELAGVFHAFEDEDLVQVPLKVSRLRVRRLGRPDVVVDAAHLHTLADARWEALLGAAVVPGVAGIPADASGPALTDPVLGAGGNAEEAAHRAVEALATRESVRALVLGETRLVDVVDPADDAAGVDDAAAVEFLLDSLTTSGFGREEVATALVDLTWDLSSGPDGRILRTVVARVDGRTVAATAPSPGRALAQALTVLLGAVQLAQAPSEQDPTDGTTDELADVLGRVRWSAVAPTPTTGSRRDLPVDVEDVTPGAFTHLGLHVARATRRAPR